MELIIAEVATALHTSVPRVTRRMARLGISGVRVVRDGYSTTVLTPAEVATLRRDLGVAPPVEGYTREELFALAAINLSPFGFRTVQALARAAVISPTTASKVVSRLVDAGLIEIRRQKELMSRRVVAVSALHLNRDHPEWRRIRSLVAKVELAQRDQLLPKYVPRRFWHLFWNAEPLRLPLSEHADFVASRMLLSDDPRAVAWAASMLPPSAIRHTATLRHASESDRRWLISLAEEREMENT